MKQAKAMTPAQSERFLAAYWHSAKKQKVFAAETVYYTSGKAAYKQGQRLLLVTCGSTCYVFDEHATTDAMKHGIGLLYTYSQGTKIEVDGKATKL